MQVLKLWQNKFTGSIPSRLGQNGKLTELDLSTNKLKGLVPKSLCFGKLKSVLEILLLHGNRFSGEIPLDIGKLKSVLKMDLSCEHKIHCIHDHLWSQCCCKGSTVEMTDLDRDDVGSEDANFLFSGHRARITTASIRYTFGDSMFEMNEVKGGSPYGTRTYAGGDGSRQPTKLELEQAFHEGKYIATITKKLKKE
ncbi:hypothetical protein HN51_005039 [Arachis hypogaea]